MSTKPREQPEWSPCIFPQFIFHCLQGKYLFWREWWTKKTWFPWSRNLLFNVNCTIMSFCKSDEYCMSSNAIGCATFNFKTTVSTSKIYFFLGVHKDQRQPTPILPNYQMCLLFPGESLADTFRIFCYDYWASCLSKCRTRGPFATVKRTDSTTMLHNRDGFVSRVCLIKNGNWAEFHRIWPDLRLNSG